MVVSRRLLIIDRCSSKTVFHNSILGQEDKHLALYLDYAYIFFEQENFFYLKIYKNPIILK